MENILARSQAARFGASARKKVRSKSGPSFFSGLHLIPLERIGEGGAGVIHETPAARLHVSGAYVGAIGAERADGSGWVWADRSPFGSANRAGRQDHRGCGIA